MTFAEHFVIAFLVMLGVWGAWAVLHCISCWVWRSTKSMFQKYFHQ